MAHKVPFLKKEEIEKDAAALLAEFSRARGVVLEAPVPIEDIVEKHLKLTIDFDDMHERHGLPKPASGKTDIMGAIYGDGSIFIDESLDPDEHPAMLGRYRFTLAHEGGGHRRLHWDLIAANNVQMSFLDESNEPKFICRSSKAKATEEWQADYYASCLLMPRDLILANWHECFPDGRPRVIQTDGAMDHPYVEFRKETIYWRGNDMGLESDNAALERMCRPLADRFLVSPIAMRIRLEELGLLIAKLEGQGFLPNDDPPF